MTHLHTVGDQTLSDYIKDYNLTYKDLDISRPELWQELKRRHPDEIAEATIWLRIKYRSPLDAWMDRKSCPTILYECALYHWR